VRPRFPLSAKILLWFFANLVLIGIGVFGFIEFEFHLGPESLLGGRAGRRVDALADLVSGEIKATPPEHWDDELARAGNLYGLRLLIAGPDGRRIAGVDIPLPDEVRARLYRPRPPQPPSPLRPPGPWENRPEPNDAGPPLRPDDGGPPPPPGPERPRERRMLHTDHPTQYWLLLAIDAPRPGPGGGPRPPMTLIAESDSIGLGGLVLDVTPWVAAAGAVIVFSLLFWLPLVRGITRSIREMTDATARVAEGRFDEPVKTERSDELGRLAQSINQMTERLSGFVNGQKRFLGDIAHELCSPLARAEVALGILEQRMGAAPLEDLREEVRQMSGLVNELLSFSKASLSAGRVKLESVSLRDVVERAIAREDLAEARIDVAIPDDLRANADPDLLCRAVSNLLRNAVKYAGDAGPVEVHAERNGGEVVLAIADHGPGVPEEALPKLFDPFYRVDASRARETGGTGLGLAIVKTCVESCGGTVKCENRAPHGLRAVLTLPAG
jgi:two-component system sensor histidine kinase CpxA